MRDDDLFSTVEPIAPDPVLLAYLDEFAPIALGIGTEMARSTFITTPVLVEAKRRSKPPMNVLPGWRWTSTGRGA